MENIARKRPYLSGFKISRAKISEKFALNTKLKNALDGRDPTRSLGENLRKNSNEYFSTFEGKVLECSRGGFETRDN